MKVAQIAPPWIPVPPVTYGGTELMVAALIRGLQSRKVETVLFAARDSTLEVPVLGPFAKAFWPPDKFSENLHLAFAFGHLRAEPPQVIHSHLENAAGFWSVSCPAVPLVITLHTPLTPMKCEYLHHFPEAYVVAVSAFQGKQLGRHPRLRLIPHGLKAEDYPFQADKEDFLLFLGRIYPDKGLHTAIRLAQEMAERLVIAGPVFAPDRAYFEQQVHPHLISDQITYVGAADFAHKVDLLKRAKALVSPLEVDEAFGLVMLEAMLCGTPVLAYGRGAVPEVVLHEETGFIAHSYAELRQGLRQLFRLDPYRSRDFVIQQFSWERMVSAHLDLYRAARH